MSSHASQHALCPDRQRSITACLAALSLIGAASAADVRDAHDRRDASSPQHTLSPINWRSGPALMPHQSPGEIAAVINNALAQNTRHLVIQLDRPVDG